MAVLTLDNYMEIKGLTVPQMAIELGRKRQNVDQWLAKGATVEILDDGQLKVRTENIVHEPQVRS